MFANWRMLSLWFQFRAGTSATREQYQHFFGRFLSIQMSVQKTIKNWGCMSRNAANQKMKSCMEVENRVLFFSFTFLDITLLPCCLGQTSMFTKRLFPLLSNFMFDNWGACSTKLCSRLSFKVARSERLRQKSLGIPACLNLLLG